MHKYFLFLWHLGLGLFMALWSKHLFLTLSIEILLSLSFIFCLSKVNKIQEIYQDKLLSHLLIQLVIESRFDYANLMEKMPKKAYRICRSNHLSTVFETIQLLADYFPSDTLDLFVYSWKETGEEFVQMKNQHDQYLRSGEFEKNRLQGIYRDFTEKLENYCKSWLLVFLFLIVSTFLLSRFYTYLNSLPFSIIFWMIFGIFPVISLLIYFSHIQSEI